MRKCAAVVASAALIGIPLAGPALANPDDLPAMIERLEVADENNAGYSSDDSGLFRYDSSKVRAALAVDERRPDGTYLSPWDGKVHTSIKTLDADHTVALAEAWGSGARNWTPDERKAFANDTQNPHVLNFVTTKLNRGAKSDSDPFDWQPDVNRCEYLKQWTSVKLQYGLTVDAEEKMALMNGSIGCEGKEPNSKPSEAPKGDDLAQTGNDNNVAALLGGAVLFAAAGGTIAYVARRKGN